MVAIINPIIAWNLDLFGISYPPSVFMKKPKRSKNPDCPLVIKLCLFFEYMKGIIPAITMQI
jgi:hypothetical protein